MSDLTVIGLIPADMPDHDLREIGRLVRQGNEVTGDALNQNIRNAHYLALARGGGGW